MSIDEECVALTLAMAPLLIHDAGTERPKSAFHKAGHTTYMYTTVCQPNTKIRARQAVVQGGLQLCVLRAAAAAAAAATMIPRVDFLQNHDE